VPGMDHGYLKQAGHLEIASQTLRAAAIWMRAIAQAEA
jgi:hypothetical protein